MSNNTIKKLVVVLVLVTAPAVTRAAGLSLTLYNSPPCINVVNGVCNSVDQTTLEGYIQTLYTFALGVGGILAVGMIIWGSIYISISGSVDKEREGRSFITSALLGLVILFSAFLILKTINPNLTTLTPPSAPAVTLPSAPSGAQPAAGASTPESYATQYPQDCNPVGQPTSSTIQSQDQIMGTLQKAGVSYSSTNNNCTNMCTTGCTSVAFLPDSAVSFLTTLKANCNCNVTITGGTEPGHASHGPNEPVFDLRSDSNLIAYLKANANTLQQSIAFIDTTSAHQDICSAVQGTSIKCSTTETEDQVHIQLK